MSGDVTQSSARATGGKAVPATFSPGLYVVATPIGNARDITLRALDLLASADIIACEDTRVTRKLLLIHGIETPTLAYHDHNAARMRPRLMERLNKGEIVALVSDAGTPLISDPGYRLVNEVRAADIAVTALPGASAPMAALAVMMMVGNVISAKTKPPTKGAERGNPKKLRKTARPKRPKTMDGTAAKLLMLTSIKSVQRFLGANSSR